jgi:UPF0755 protein
MRLTRRSLVRVLAGLALLGALGLAGAVGAFWRALAPAQPGAGPGVFEVPRGASLSAIARELETAGLIRSARAFAWLARLRGQAERLHAGEYELSASSSSGEILERIATGRIKTWEVVLPEGLRVEEVAERLTAAGLADAEAFVAFARDPASAEALRVEGPTLEGYLFPETYRLPRGLLTREVAASLVGQFLGVWSEIGPLAAERGLSMRDVVTLASIVEKETGAAGERPVIAGVFLNRLERGMRLESDPTVIYGIADFDGNLRRVDLEDASNAYNTYQIEGLPPGPIANPGAASLRAVVEPASTNYLYFVSRNDGTHVFSRTYREHASAVDRYQKAGRPR